MSEARLSLQLLQRFPAVAGLPELCMCLIQHAGHVLVLPGSWPAGVLGGVEVGVMLTPYRQQDEAGAGCDDHKPKPEHSGQSADCPWSTDLAAER